jgi:hypothetical protein
MSCNIRQSYQVLTKVHYIYSGHHLEHLNILSHIKKKPSKALTLEGQYLKDANNLQ